MRWIVGPIESSAIGRIIEDIGGVNFVPSTRFRSPLDIHGGYTAAFVNIVVNFTRRQRRAERVCAHEVGVDI